MQELLFEEKNRLGSIPPSCHNKCNECHPCMAVQVPTLPNHDPVQPDLTKTSAMEGSFRTSLLGNRYSNYKPLGWKCHCGDHFFNPQKLFNYTNTLMEIMIIILSLICKMGITITPLLLNLLVKLLLIFVFLGGGAWYCLGSQIGVTCVSIDCVH